MNVIISSRRQCDRISPKKVLKRWIINYHGLHACRAGVLCILVRGRCVGSFEGVIGRIDGPSGFARRMNCKGANGDPDDGGDLTVCGLRAPGVEMVKEGMKGPDGSGVRGGGGVAIISGASNRVAELIHFSSLDPNRGEPNRGDSGGIILNWSAKWSLMNLENGQSTLGRTIHRECMTYLDNSCHPPPTRTITVCDRRIRQKHNLGS